jgi:Protein of unknown function (DUF2934)
MATAKKGNGTAPRRRTKSAAKQSSVAAKEPKDTTAQNGKTATGPKVETSVQPIQVDAIRVRAYELFLARGAAHGNDVSDWLNAEKELRGAEKR